MENKQIDILDVLLVLAKHKKFIFWVVLVVSIISVAYALLTPQYWKSTTTIQAIDESGNSSLSLAGANILGIGASLLGGIHDNSAEDFITIIKSRFFTEKIVNKFDLIKYFEIKEEDPVIKMEMALESFQKKMRTIYFDDDLGLLVISILSKDKLLSAEIANFIVDELEKYNINNKLTKGKLKRQFIENRLNEVKNQLASLTERIETYQSENRIINIEEQAKSVIDIYSELISDKYEKEIELHIANSIYGEESQQSSRLKTNIDIVDMKLSELEQSEENDAAKYILNLNDFSDIASEYAALLLNQEIQANLYSFLFAQYEEAKIVESKDLPTLEVIDIAKPSGRRYSPKRAKLCITNFILSLFIASFLSFVLEFFRKHSKRWDLVKNQLFK